MPSYRVSPAIHLPPKMRTFDTMTETKMDAVAAAVNAVPTPAWAVATDVREIESSSHERAMMRDPAFPDVDADVMSLLAGPIQSMREQAKFLIKCLNQHRDIDQDLWNNLGDIAGDLLNQTDLVCCVEHLREEKVQLGRGRGFDAVLCDDCEQDAVRR